MVRTLRTIAHEDRLSLVDHLDELRMRLIVSAAVLAVAFGLCLWQNHTLLEVMNKPLQAQTRKQVSKGEGTVGQTAVAQQGLAKVARDTKAALGTLAAPASGLSPQARGQLSALEKQLAADVSSLPKTPPGDRPVTLGVGEPFTTTITVTFYFALILALPVILYELYGFVLPALDPRERRAVTPLLLAVPFLFVGGVLFGYFVVLPAAIRFFTNFNSSEFNVLVQANQLYNFEATVLLAMGVIFQVPILILGAVRAGLVTPRQLRRNRRYAVIACAVVAALLPGDLITMLLETVPLYLLYEASILLSTFFKPASAGVGYAAGAGEAAVPGGVAAAAAAAPEPTVQDMIDHVDPSL
jgi:sec-independent protein translocase protein TatC